MTFQNEDNQTLTGLGLTILQARIYLALAKLGKATVITISKASKVTRPDVYRILSELQELGLVEKIISMPTEFEAIPIDGCLSLLLQRRNNQTAELQRKARKLLQKRTKNNEKVKLQEKEFQLILLSGTRKLHKSKKAFENAQTSISIVTKRGGEGCVHMPFDMIEEVKRAMRRGVKIQIVTQKPEPKKSSSLRFIQDLAKNPFFKIRYTRNPPAATVIVYDKKEALIMTCFKTSQSESTALWSDTPTLITLATNYFEVMWNTALEDNSKNTAEAPSSYNQVVS